MKIRVTATITWETELGPDDYVEIEGSPKTDDEVIPFEMKMIAEGDDVLTSDLRMEGELSDIKIEKLEETAEAAEAA